MNKEISGGIHEHKGERRIKGGVKTIRLKKEISRYLTPHVCNRLVDESLLKMFFKLYTDKE